MHSWNTSSISSRAELPPNVPRARTNDLASSPRRTALSVAVAARCDLNNQTSGTIDPTGLGHDRKRRRPHHVSVFLCIGACATTHDRFGEL